MTAEDEAISTSRALVATGWVWAPGQVMLMIVEHGDSRTVIPAVVTVLYEGVPISATHLGGGLGVVGEMVPDMRDPGTRGHAAMRPRHCAECRLFLTPGQVLDGWEVHPGCEPVIEGAISGGGRPGKIGPGEGRRDAGRLLGEARRERLVRRWRSRWRRWTDQGR